MVSFIKKSNFNLVMNYLAFWEIQINYCYIVYLDIKIVIRNLIILRRQSFPLIVTRDRKIYDGKGFLSVVWEEERNAKDTSGYVKSNIMVRKCLKMLKHSFSKRKATPNLLWVDHKGTIPSSYSFPYALSNMPHKLLISHSLLIHR